VSALALLAAASALAAQLEERTTLGRRVSAPLLAMTLAGVAAAALPVPAAGVAAACAVVWARVLPLAIALSLLTTDLRRLAHSREALSAFTCAVLGTVVGTLVAFAAAGAALGPHAWRLAACLCASYTGGSLNFGATAAITGLSAAQEGRALTVAAMALDNIAMAIFLGVLMALPAQQEDVAAAATHAAAEESDRVSVGSAVAAAVAAACCICAADALALQLRCPAASLALAALLASLAATAAACAGVRPARAFAGADAAARALLLLFFAALGAGTDARAALALGAPAAAFIALQLSTHLAVTLSLGAALHLPRRTLLIASNAAVGGPATAAAMAAARGWREQSGNAVLLGTVGYLIGTGVGTGTGALLQRISGAL
jgi:uncharacterized membrane protein